MNLPDLYIFGSTYRDIVKLVGAINQRAPQWNLRGFIDDQPHMQGTSILGYPVVGDRSVLQTLRAPAAAVFNNVTGKARNARAIADLIEPVGAPPPNLVHPGVDLAYVQIGHGCILPQGCVVGSGSVIGNFLAARLHSVISHDVTIEDFVFIGPGTVVGSGAHIEEGAFLGAGVTIMTGCRVGRHSVIGAGAVVTRDVPADSTLIGGRGYELRSGGRE